jgi:predicted nucleic acid-binding protein
MIILDTNVVSALMRNSPEPDVAKWLDRQPPSSIWTTSITILEIGVGLRILPAGRKQTFLSEGFEGLLNRIQHRIAVFGEESARLAAGLTATRQKNGRVGEVRDTMIAGIVLTHRARLATRNISHFDDIGATVINPWTA